ncbi:One cut domain family member 2 [Varanus komodoensis]|nr:One cut domain family member 2 [Varanus komodoensis]
MLEYNACTRHGPKTLQANLQVSLPGQLEEINTKEVAQRITAELKRYSIPQAIFAQRVLCRSQGTLSDLLRNPKPWSKLKSGRETFRRMWKWLQEPEFQRMSALRLAGELRARPRLLGEGAAGRRRAPARGAAGRSVRPRRGADGAGGRVAEAGLFAGAAGRPGRLPGLSDVAVPPAAATDARPAAAARGEGATETMPRRGAARAFAPVSLRSGASDASVLLEGDVQPY